MQTNYTPLKEANNGRERGEEGRVARGEKSTGQSRDGLCQAKCDLGGAGLLKRNRTAEKRKWLGMLREVNAKRGQMGRAVHIERDAWAKGAGRKEQ